MSSKYPPLTPRQVCKILIALGFTQHKSNRSDGDHRVYKDSKGCHVEVDMGEKDFRTPGMKIIISNTGVSSEKFYGATKSTAKKIQSLKKKK